MRPCVVPLILVDGEVVAEGSYPSRDELAVLAGRNLATTTMKETLKIVPCCTSKAGISSGKCC
ncbi:MAG: arsenic metallochaperone ArsD family protein [Pirellulaceae bacterium]